MRLGHSGCSGQKVALARQSTSSLRGRLSLPLVDTPLTPVPRVAADAPIAARSHSKRAASLTSPLQGAPETSLMPSLPLGKLSPGRHITQSSAVGSARLAAGLPRQAHSTLLAPFAGTAAREVTNRVPRRRSLGAAKSAPERLFQPGDLAERVANHWRTPLAHHASLTLLAELTVCSYLNRKPERGSPSRAPGLHGSAGPLLPWQY